MYVQRRKVGIKMDIKEFKRAIEVLKKEKGISVAIIFPLLFFMFKTDFSGR